MMTGRWRDGFDTTDNSHEATWYAAGSWTIGTPGRFGVGSYADITTAITKTFEGGPFVYMAAGRAVRWTSVGGDDIVLEFRNGNQHCRLRRDGSGFFYISWAGGSPTTEVYTGLTAQTNVWYHVGLAAKWNGTTGQMRAWINGNLVMSKDNIDTDNDASANDEFSTLLIGGGHLDDLWVDADDSISGTLSEQFRGDCIVRDHMRQTDGDHLQWTPLGSGAHYVEVDEVGPDDDTSYLTDATPGNRDCGSVGTLSPDVASIVDVQLCNVSRYETTGPHSIANSVRRVGISDHDSAAHALSINHIGYHDILPTDPVTGLSWTKAGFEARQYGIKNES